MPSKPTAKFLCSRKKSPEEHDVEGDFWGDFSGDEGGSVMDCCGELPPIGESEPEDMIWVRFSVNIEKPKNLNLRNRFHKLERNWMQLDKAISIIKRERLLERCYNRFMHKIWLRNNIYPFSEKLAVTVNILTVREDTLLDFGWYFDNLKS